jgi:drug/metabolite transporter (DMT)-like permease
MTTLIICLISLLVWVIPTIVAFKREHPSKMAILIVNLLSIITMVGYGALIAFSSDMDRGTSLVAGLGVIVAAALSIFFWLVALIKSFGGVKK